jgi:putative ABC transport system permease protein
MMRSFWHIYTANSGFEAGDIVTALLRLPTDRYPQADTQISFYDRLAARLMALPDVASVGIASVGPTGDSSSIPYEHSESALVDVQRRPVVSTSFISPTYFQTLGKTVLSGRAFTDFDTASSVPVILVNELFATENWPGQPTVGQRLRLFDGKSPGAWLTVVGVVPNVASKDRTRQDLAPSVYVPYRQQPRVGMWVWMRARAHNDSIGNAFRREVQALDPDLPTVLGPRELTEFLAESYQYRGTTGALFLTCAVIALVLASVGLYAVIAHAVSQRTREIGVRMVVGATAGDILTFVFRRGMSPVGIGLTIGLVVSLAVNRILKAQLVQVSPSDPTTLIITTAVLLVAATLGCWVPARHATKVDPLVALRCD